MSNSLHSSDRKYIAMEWNVRLRRSGMYYEGFVGQDELDALLELHKRITRTTYGITTSSRLGKKACDNEDKENCPQNSAGKVGHTFGYENHA